MDVQIIVYTTTYCLGTCSPLDTGPHFPKTCKFALGMLTQLLQYTPHLSQLSLQLCPSLIVRPSIKLKIDLTLDRGCFLSDVLRHCLRDEFRVESCLHKSWKCVFGA